MYKATIPEHKRLAEGKFNAPSVPKTRVQKRKRKMTKTQDDAFDRKHGIKEGSKRDIAEDKKHGVKDKRGKKRKASKVGAIRTIKPSKPGQKPIKYRVGSLHQATGTPQGEKIPKSKLRGALGGKYGNAAKKKAELAVNVFHVKAKRKKRK